MVRRSEPWPAHVAALIQSHVSPAGQPHDQRAVSVKIST